jgi:hypothetical protein
MQPEHQPLPQRPSAAEIVGQKVGHFSAVHSRAIGLRLRSFTAPQSSAPVSCRRLLNGKPRSFTTSANPNFFDACPGFPVTTEHDWPPARKSSNVYWIRV